ncbi:hypothetical protein ABEF95_008778 [Exophiala dermatitidis]
MWELVWKKIKCDGVRPRCDYCQHHGLKCTFTRAPGGPKRASRSKRLEESDLVRRMERIEQLITENIKRRNGQSDPIVRDRDANAVTNDPRPHGSVRNDSPSVANVGRIYCAGYQLGDINLFHGVPFLSREGQKWIGFRTEETDVNPGMGAQGPLWQNRGPVWPTIPWLGNMSATNGKSPQLPPRAVPEKCFELYLRSEVSSVFPIADPVLFPQILEKAYNAGLANAHEVLPAKACVLSFSALAATLLGDTASEPLPPIDVSDYGNAAAFLFADIVNARPSTEAVGALMMLAVYQFTCGHIQPLDITLSTASRFLVMLGAHLYPGEDVDVLPSEPQSIETRTILHRRDLFWMCYNLDKEITFRTGRPPIWNDTSCDLTFPKWYSKQTAPDFTGNFRLPGDLGLSLVKSKAYEKLYSPHSLKKSDAEILRDIRELDELLENWRHSQPTVSRPKLSFSQERSGWLYSDDLHHPRIHSFFLRLEYYHCMTTIHQASSRCKNWTHNHRIQEGLSSSLDLALESSRSLLSCLHAGDSVLLLAPNLFWVVLFYPLSATLILFCNVLLNPASPVAASDTRLLRSCLDYINNKLGSISSLSESQLLHLQSVQAFAAEVVRSAESLVSQNMKAG